MTNHISWVLLVRTVNWSFQKWRFLWYSSYKTKKYMRRWTEEFIEDKSSKFVDAYISLFCMRNITKIFTFKIYCTVYCYHFHSICLRSEIWRERIFVKIIYQYQSQYQYQCINIIVIDSINKKHVNCNLYWILSVCYSLHWTSNNLMSETHKSKTTQWQTVYEGHFHGPILLPDLHLVNPPQVWLIDC